MTSASRIRMSPTYLHILLALMEGERHGYRMMQEIKTRSGGKIDLGPSTLYWALGKLEEGGLIEEAGERPAPEFDDERRRYWRITKQGQGVLRSEMETLAELVAQAQTLKVIR